MKVKKKKKKKKKKNPSSKESNTVYKLLSIIRLPLSF